MGNICGSANTHKDSPTHHRLGSGSDYPPRSQGQNAAAARPPQARPAQTQPTRSQSPQSQPPPQPQPQPSRSQSPRTQQSQSRSKQHKPSNSEQDREMRAKAAEERAKAATARGTNASNPKQGQLASKINKPVVQPNQREEEPLRWD